MKTSEAVWPLSLYRGLGEMQMAVLNRSLLGSALFNLFRILNAWGQRRWQCVSERMKGLGYTPPFSQTALHRPGRGKLQTKLSEIPKQPWGVIVLQSRSKPAAITINLD